MGKMKISEILAISDTVVVDMNKDPKICHAKLIAEMESKLREMMQMLPEINQLLIQHYHTDLEDKAHEMLVKLNTWENE